MSNLNYPSRAARSPYRPTADTLAQNFRRAPTAVRKQALASKWLDRTLEDIHVRGTPIHAILHELMKMGVNEVRELVLAIPTWHPALARTWKQGVSATAWLPNYLNVSRPLVASTITCITRGMWLSPTLDERKRFLLAAREHLGTLNSIGPQAAVLLCKTAWDTAEADSMSAEAVATATAITLNAYQGSNQFTPEDSRPVMQAMLVLLSRCDGYEDRGMPNESAKAIIAQHPAACARLLWFLDNRVQFRTHIIHGGYSTELDRTDSLVTWLPAYESAIRIASDMGTPYATILAQVIKSTVSSDIGIPLDNVSFG